MDLMLEILGLIAGGITSIGFTPQIIRGIRTKKLDDISYYMPGVLSIGMTLWFIYGYYIFSYAVMIANAFGVACSLFLIFLKNKYSKN